MDGHHFMKGRWMLMAHASADVVYDDQGGPRGEEDVYAPTMGMLMAQRPLGPGRRSNRRKKMIASARRAAISKALRRRCSATGHEVPAGSVDDNTVFIRGF